MNDRKLVWRADEVGPAGFAFSHPMDDRAEVRFHPLSRLAGLTGTGVNLLHVPPGKTSFPLHRHHVQDEWSYILQGSAEVTIGDDVQQIGPGDFVAFPAGGEAHVIRNTSDEHDLVYLTGGGVDATEIVDFPDAGQRMIRRGEQTEIAPVAAFSTFDFFSKSDPPGG